MQGITMDIRALAVASLSLLLVIATAGAEDVKIMGLMDTNAARSDSTRPLAYLTGNCQKKPKRMKCHLNEITVTKLDTTLFEAKANEVMEQVKQNPHNVDRVIARQMPYLCPDPTTGQDRLDEPSQSATLSPGEQELRQATRQFCAAKTADTLRALLDLRITMQARTCALWVTSYDKDFTLRGTEWVSTQGPEGPWGVMETAVFSSTLYDSHGQTIRLGPGETAVYRVRVYRLEPTAIWLECVAAHCAVTAVRTCERAAAAHGVRERTGTTPHPLERIGKSNGLLAPGSAGAPRRRPRRLDSAAPLGPAACACREARWLGWGAPPGCSGGAGLGTAPGGRQGRDDGTRACTGSARTSPMGRRHGASA